MTDLSEISFRPLAIDDMPLMMCWLSAPDVARWFGPPPDSIASLEAKYGPRIRGEELVYCYVMLHRDTPFGFIQTYRLDIAPEYADALGVDRNAMSVDLFIGEDAERHRGLGPVALREFVKRIVFDEKDAPYCVIAPSISNAIAIRAYEKAGFRHVRTVDVPDEDEPEYVMVMKQVDGAPDGRERHTWK